MTSPRNVNVTVGNLPCNGNAKIVYSGPSGSNQMSGTLNLPRNKEQISINLDLSASDQVSGTMQVVESNTTLSATNLSGPITGDLACDFTMAPQGYSGTGTITLATASLSLNFSNPSGASSSIDSSGNLVIKYPDGTTQTIDDPITALLTGSGGTSGTSATGTTATGTTATTATGTNATTTGNAQFASPVATKWGFQGNQGYDLNDSDSAGEVVGRDQVTFFPLFATSPTATPQQLNSNSNDGIAYGINSNRAIVGTIFPSGQQNAVIWNSPSAAPTVLKIPTGYTQAAATGINDSGQIVGSTRAPSGLVGLFWSSAQAIALPFTIPIETSIPRIDGLSHIFIASDFGTGYVYASGYLGTPTNLVAINQSGGNSASVSGIQSFSSAGVVGSSAPFAFQGVATLWASPDYEPQAVPLTGDVKFSGLNAVNKSGEMAGWFKQSDGVFHVAMWEPNKTETDLTSLLKPLGITGQQATQMLNDGSVIFSGNLPSKTLSSFYLKRKP